MHVLVFNADASSLKCSVFDTTLDRQLFKIDLRRLESIEAAIRRVPALLAEADIAGIEAVAHRVVHGGSRFDDACPIDDDVVAAIAACADLAPLHNPPALAGIRAARECWPGLPQVAVFDTAFHHAMPERAFTYAVPKAWRATGARRYGFHGTSHKYLMQHAAAALHAAPEDLRLISCHLGNGASICAIERGVSIDTSMGMTTLEGLVMGTRSGDVDPGLFAHLHRTLGLGPAEVEDALYRHSGLAALCDGEDGMRGIEARAAANDPRAHLAIQVYVYRVRKYIGAYAAAMGGVDAIVFSGGIGENSAAIRMRICERFDFLGLAFDDDVNAAVHLACEEVVSLHQAHSRVKVLVTAAREQWMLAREAERVLGSAAPKAIPIAVSAHHVHLMEAAHVALFGPDHTLHMHKPLSQPGQWAADETVDVIGPGGELRGLRIVGPCRAANQIEISETDAFALGLEAPLRLSGDTQDTPTVTLRGPAGTLRSDGLIVAQRHIHTNPDDARALGLADGEPVDVEVRSHGRSLVFKDVAVRIRPDFATEMHVDTDEGNAAHLEHGGAGVLTHAPQAQALIHKRRPRKPPV